MFSLFGGKELALVSGNSGFVRPKLSPNDLASTIISQQTTYFNGARKICRQNDVQIVTEPLQIVIFIRVKNCKRKDSKLVILLSELLREMGRLSDGKGDWYFRVSQNPSGVDFTVRLTQCRQHIHTARVNEKIIENTEIIRKETCPIVNGNEVNVCIDLRRDFIFEKKMLENLCHWYFVKNNKQIKKDTQFESERQHFATLLILGVNCFGDHLTFVSDCDQIKGSNCVIPVSPSVNKPYPVYETNILYPETQNQSYSNQLLPECIFIPSIESGALSDAYSSCDEEEEDNEKNKHNKLNHLEFSQHSARKTKQSPVNRHRKHLLLPLLIGIIVFYLMRWI